MSNRVMQTHDDILYHLKKETGCSEQVLKLVLDNYWKSVSKTLLDPFTDVDKVMLTGLLTFHKYPIKVLKMLERKKRTVEKYKTYDKKENQLELINKKINEIKIKQTV